MRVKDHKLTALGRKPFFFLVLPSLSLAFLEEVSFRFFGFFDIFETGTGSKRRRLTRKQLSDKASTE